jgi:chromosome segregation protein
LRNGIFVFYKDCKKQKRYMYLSSIELIGFKSFAQKTKLTFTDGLSAVVGPNGCGKSNIVDAVRWVLGEKRASVLRSEVMENVIFNGSRKRKPLGMAEVTLTIENNKKILPLEYDQVTITRRLFRSGESEYLLNKVKCRMRDIHELFMDTGMGSDSYSVIELKMVEALLSGRVDDRRRIFEEAAGIKKYKQRRKETLSRLEAVNRDMERYVDIIEEVRKNVFSLSRQASKTRRYNTLRQELEEIEMKLYAHEYKKLNTDKELMQISLSALTAEKDQIEKKHSEYIATINSLKKELSEIEEKNELATAEEKALNTLIKEKERSLAVTQERIISSEVEAGRLEKELDDAKIKKQTILNELKFIEERLAGLEANKKTAEADLTELKIEGSELNDKTNELRKQVSTCNEQMFSIKHNITSHKDSLNRLESRKQTLTDSMSKLDSQTEDLNRQLSQLEEKRLELENAQKDFESEVSNAKMQLERAQEEKKVLEQNIDSYRERLDNSKSELSSRKASLVFLEGLESGSESVKYLSKSKWLEGKDKTLFGEITDTNDKFRVALHAALGDAGQSFIVDDDVNAFEAIEMLKSNKKGKVGFISTAKSKAPHTENSSIKGEGIFGKVSSLVDSSDEIKNVLELLLGATYIVATRADAAKALTMGADRAVTLEGEIFHKSGYIQGGSSSKSEGITIGRKERIKKLNAEIKSWEEKVAELDTKIRQARESVVLLDIPDFESKLRQAEREQTQNKNDQARLEIQFESAYRNQQLTDENKDSYIKEISNIDGEIKNHSTEIERLEPMQLQAEKDYAEYHQSLMEFEGKLNQFNDNLKTAEIKHVQVQSDISQALDNINRLKADNIRLDEESERKKAEITASLNSKEILAKEIVELQIVLEESIIKENEASAKVALTSEERKVISEQIELNSNEIEMLQKELLRKSEQIHKIDLTFNEVVINLNFIIARSQENYSVELATYEYTEEEDFSIENSKKEIEELKDKLSKLGSINFQALEEFDVQKERLDFSERQMQDLLDSKEILNQTIAEINVQAEKNFSETFEAIRINFKMLFQKLFGEEGEADIVLANDDLLEADIEVSAKPPGKKPHSIEMLSGGEKTLTAIALLFAIYLVKPSPFCILDEVDAPLDDKNITKFLDMIKDFGNNTQFLLVTHNKTSMAESENLYGITMQEDGVSKVVSVNLEAIK